jgi:cell division protein ZapA (FtsZ GTPase activity inhibitor)
VVNHQRAAMINSLADVERFVAELDPTVWVLDMARINFMTAVNVVARIAKYQS